MIVPDGDGHVPRRCPRRPRRRARRRSAPTSPAARTSEDVDTIGGLVFSLLGRIPVRGELVQRPGGFEFEMLDADPRRIKRLRITAAADCAAARAAPQRRVPPQRAARTTDSRRLRRRSPPLDRSGATPVLSGRWSRIAGRIIRLRGWRRLAARGPSPGRCRRWRSRRSTSSRCSVADLSGLRLADRRRARAAKDAAWRRRLLPAAAVGWWFGFGYFLGRPVVDRRRLPGRRRPVRLADAVRGPRRCRPGWRSSGRSAPRSRALFWSDGWPRILVFAAAHGGGRMAARPSPHRLSLERLRLRADAGAGDDAVGRAGRPLGADARSPSSSSPRPAALAPAPAAARAARGRSPPLPRRFSRRISPMARSASPAPAKPASCRTRRSASSSRPSTRARNGRPTNDDEIVRRYLTLSAREFARPLRPRRRRHRDLARVGVSVPPHRPARGADGHRAIPAAGHDARSPARSAPSEPPGGSRRRSSTASYVIDDQGAITAAYDKVHLVPFGEYLPFRRCSTALGIRQLIAHAGGFSPAPRRRTLTVPGAAAVRAADLLRDHLPGAVSATGTVPAGCSTSPTTPGSATRPGPTSTFYQARVRAVEEGLPLVRAANSGISAIVDAYGRIVAQPRPRRRGIVDGERCRRLLHRPFTRAMGDWLFLGLLAACRWAYR